MAIITNIDKLRISEIEENLANDKVLTIDSTGLVSWKNQDEITPDLSGYYTKIDVDAILEDYYDKLEVDALLSDIDLSGYYTKMEVDALIDNISYNDILNTPTKLSEFENDEGFISEIKTDISLFFNNETKELRSNIGEAEQRFIYSAGSEQTFELTDKPSITPVVTVQGVGLDWLTQFSIDVQSKKITILDELEEGDLVNIQYKFIITN